MPNPTKVGASFAEFAELSGNPPVPSTDTLQVYSKDNGAGLTHLYSQDAAGNVVDITAGSTTPASTTTSGIIEIATNAEAAAGTDTVRAMTPDDTKYAIQNGTFYTQAGTGATAQTVVARLKKQILVTDFGAVGDGSTDDTTAISNAITYVNSLAASVGSPASWHYPELVFPSGDYKITSGLTACRSMRGLGQARIVASSTAFDIFTNAAITRLDVADLTFVNGQYAFKIGNDNIDNGLYNFTRCHFYANGSYSINACSGTPGPYSTVLNCTDCNWYKTNGGIVTTCDIVNIQGSWAEPSYTNWTVDQAFFSVFHGTTYVGQQLNITKFVGVPVLYDGVSYYKGRWIDFSSAGSISAYDCRFGGESSGIPIIYWAGGYETSAPYRGGSISITDSVCYAGNSVNSWSGAINVRGQMPLHIHWQGNVGPASSVPIVVNEGAGSGGVTVATYLSGWVTATSLASNDIANYFTWNIDLSGFYSTGSAVPTGCNNITRFVTSPGAVFPGDANYTIKSTDRVILLTTALTTTRTLTLPAANTLPAGDAILIVDYNAVTSVNVATIARAGSDTIEGGTAINLNTAYAHFRLVSDGVSKWSYPIQSISQGGTGANSAATALTALGAVGTPGSTTDRAVATWNGTSGASLRNTGVTIDASNNVSGAVSLQRSAGVAVQGTNTNDSAASGYVGEYIASVCPSVNGTSSTVTITNASPGIVSWTAHGMNIGGPVWFSTTGALPTGLTTNTRYWVSSQSFTANSFAVSTTVQNALAGTSINTSSAGSGTHTAFSSLLYLTTDTTTTQNLTAISLTAGDWDVAFQASFIPNPTTTTQYIVASVSTSSATIDLGDGRTSTFSYPAASAVVNTMTANIIPCRYSLSATTTIFGSVNWNLATSAGIITGKLNARRVR